MPVIEKRSALLIGTFISASKHNHSVGEDLAEKLAERGWRVTTTSGATTRLARLVDMVTTAWRKRDEYAVAQVDVYSGLAFGWAEVACWTLRRARKPYILTLRGGNLPAFARRWPGRVRHLLGSAAAVTTPSSYLLEHMAPYRSSLQLLPNPLDLHDYVFRLRKQVAPRLMWVRAFHEIYNPTLAPDVVARLRCDFPSVHLTMVGPDKGDGSLQRMKQQAAVLGIGDRITCTGGVPKPEVSHWISKGDIFINTANVDNAPVTVLEAMACGLCVVSTCVGGIPYLLEHEHDALLVPAGAPSAMAQAVRRILTEPGLAERLSRNARRKAEQMDWSAVLPRWEHLLEETAAPCLTG